MQNTELMGLIADMREAATRYDVVTNGLSEFVITSNVDGVLHGFKVRQDRNGIWRKTKKHITVSETAILTPVGRVIL